MGITHLSYYPFDSLAFLSSGYDRTVKVFSSETLQISASFDLGSVVYSHAISTVASHLLVACATQHAAVRLADLRSGSCAHTLSGHSGSLLAVSWHPMNENVLVSGGTDGTIRVWDVRRSVSNVAVLDMDDNIGIVGYDGRGTGARRRERGKAHTGSVNGLVWTDDGRHLVSTGHDERMRVWDMNSGANTLANFGPALKNAKDTAMYPLLAPSRLSPPGKEVVYFPNPRQILGFDLHSGSLLTRLRVERSESTGANTQAKTTSLAWRAHAIELYSAHLDGTIRRWCPRTPEDVAVESEEDETGSFDGNGDRKRKREELEQIVRGLSQNQTTRF